ncbi:MAG TPA: hypothetical protein VMA77_14500 [Solirubrobacteraceae bacterium]|nr:hypothetical protein [Solirubrobacteraceae bacterium]
MSFSAGVRKPSVWRVDAGSQLRTAYDQFTSIGMEAFADRTRRELAASGQTVRKRTVEARDELTAQERQVALLARDGMSNRGRHVE